MKLDAAGNIEWQKRYSADHGSFTQHIQQTPTGDYLVVGYSFPVDDVPYTRCLKLDRLGNVIWVKTYSIPGRGVTALSASLTLAGGVVMAGASDGPIMGDDDQDAFVMKVNELGEVEWFRLYRGEARDQFFSVQEIGNANIIAVGGTRSFGFGEDDAWLVKLDRFGNILRQRVYGGVGNDLAFSVRKTLDEGFIIAGDSNSHTPDYAAWALRVDSALGRVWERAYGGTVRESFQAVRLAADGGYIFAGTASLVSGSSYQPDLFLVRTSAAGDIDPTCGNLVSMPFSPSVSTTVAPVAMTVTTRAVSTTPLTTEAFPLPTLVRRALICQSRD